MSDLTDRMRTCAAFLTGRQIEGISERALDDAADLLIEASNALEAATAPGHTDLMVTPESIDAFVAANPQPPLDLPPPPSQGTWVAPGDALPTWPRTPRPRNEWACPKCDSRTIKGVVRHGNRLDVVCPVCGHTWPYKAKETP